MRALAAALLAAFAATQAPACDYPGPPPGAGEARADGAGIVWAGFSDATRRYDHGILGDDWEAGGLRALAGAQGPCDLAVILPETRVFEDTGPRLADLDGDGAPEIIVVETDIARGATLAVYGLSGGRLVKLAATAPIGRSHRWLAPVAIADLDGDGSVEIAYIDRPHLARILRILRYETGGATARLVEIASAQGHTNHRIGDAAIAGGLRFCAGRPELITLSPDWSTLLATSFAGGRLVTQPVGRNTPPALALAMRCR